MNSSEFKRMILFLGSLSAIVSVILLPVASAEGGYGSNCTADDNCGMGLSCNKGECDCKEPKEMIYDNKTSTCIVLESFSCGINTTQYQCIGHAACVPGPNSTDSRICKCETGYSPTHENKCKKDIGEKCNEDSWNDCNDYALLVCQVNPGESVGKCGCYSQKENVYDTSVKKCIALAGGKCTHKPPYSLNCIKNATCKFVENGTTKNTTGVCKCDKGYINHGDGRCENGVSSFIPGFSHIFVVVAIIIAQFS